MQIHYRLRELVETSGTKMSLSILKKILSQLISHSESFIHETESTKSNPQVKEMRIAHEARLALAKAIVSAINGDTVPLNVIVR
jgi:hypothetical protein